MRPKYDSDIDCQAAKNHKDLKIAEQNQGAVQAGWEQNDPNYIMDKYKRTGALPKMIESEPMWGDFSGANDFLSALEIIQKGEEQFANLDAHIRARFGNDPAQFLAFAEDKANLDEMRKMGLAKPQEPAVPAQSGPPGPSGQAKPDPGAPASAAAQPPTT